MYVQFSEGFPGVVLEGLDETGSPKNGHIHVDRTKDLNKQLERLYAAYLDNKIVEFPIGEKYAAGLHRFLSLGPLHALGVKGHVTGPVSWGLTITDQDRRSIIYDDTLADAAAKLLRLKAAWQEQELRRLSRNTIVFVDEPYMASFGSAFVSVSKERVIALLEEVLGGITGVKGIHCCGNTDWSVLLSTSLDIISFDAYNYAQSLSLYPADIGRLLDKSGTIAWGIVPVYAESLAKETVSSLKDRLEDAMAPFTRQGIRFRQLVAQSLLTPSCGLATLPTPDAAARALELLAGLSDTMRQHYL
jgi:methionine synthase II (cobalamin-independent)